MQDSHALRADLVLQRDRLQDQCDQQSGQIQALRAQLDDNQAALRTERERQEAHIRAVEDRAHQEVDRARQEAKQWQQRHEATNECIENASPRSCKPGTTRPMRRSTPPRTGSCPSNGPSRRLEKALSEAYLAAAGQMDPPAGSQALAKPGSRKKSPSRKSASKRGSAK